MRTAAIACVLLVAVAGPVSAEGGSNQPTGAMDCPMTGDGSEMQNQMGTMLSDMRVMMEGTSDAALKARMRGMHERMSAMMATMQKMHGGMMHGPTARTERGTEPPATPPPAAGKQDHDTHHPAQ